MSRSTLLPRPKKAEPPVRAPLESYELALWGSMSPWRSYLIGWLSKLSYDTRKVLDPSLPTGSWTEADQKWEADAKEIIPYFIDYVGGSREDPSQLGVQTIRGIDKLAQSTKKGLFVFDARGLDTHAVKVLQRAVRELAASGCTVVWSIGDALPWLVEQLGLQEAALQLALREQGSAINEVTAASVGAKPVADFAHKAREMDQPAVDFWCGRIDATLEEFTKKGHAPGRLPTEVGWHMVMYRMWQQRVWYAPWRKEWNWYWYATPNPRVVQRLNEIYGDRLQVVVHELSRSDRDYFNYGGHISEVQIRAV